MVDEVFLATLVGQGSGGHMALELFEAGLSDFTFSPCQYDQKTNTITVSWTTAPGAGENDYAEGLYGIKAVSFDLNSPGYGVVASWEDASDGASITFYGKQLISVANASSITKGDLSSLSPALAEWAAALIKESGKPVAITVE
jgi:hypothetical protein